MKWILIAIGLISFFIILNRIHHWLYGRVTKSNKPKSRLCRMGIHNWQFIEHTEDCNDKFKCTYCDSIRIAPPGEGITFN